MIKFSRYVNAGSTLSTHYAFMMWREEERTFSHESEFDDAAKDLMHYFTGDGM